MVRYRLKPNRRKELQNGMTLTYIADTLGITSTYVIGAFNGKYPLKKPVAASIISLKERVYVGSKDCEEFLDYYFTREEDKLSEQ